MKNLVIERLRDAVRDAYPPGRTTVRTADLEWIIAQAETGALHALKRAEAELELARIQDPNFFSASLARAGGTGHAGEHEGTDPDPTDR